MVNLTAVPDQVDLPETSGIHIEEVDEEELPTQGQEALLHDGEDASLPRILVVEDNADLCAMIEEALSTDFDVRCATGGEEGVRVARAYRPDVVILDLILPDGNGFEVGQKLKSEAGSRALPILLLTAVANWEEHAQAEGACDKVLVKPATLAEIRRAIKELLADGGRPLPRA